MQPEQQIADIAARWPSLSWQERLADAARLSEKVAFSTSLGFEDQAMLHAIARAALPIRIFTLDTGRLFPQSYELLHASAKYYGVPIDTFFPEAEAVQAYVAAYGVNGFYDSVEHRKRCCHIRKVEPLLRALKDTEFWISGLRAEQSDSRASLPFAQWDEGHQLIKLYPLLDVSEADLNRFIEAEGVPINPLHAQGFPSIGCAPCTRAVQPGEHPRAGRWWWEQEAGGECGLHVVDGKLVPLRKGPRNPEETLHA